MCESKTRPWSEAAETLRAMPVDELPTISGVGILDCPACRRPLVVTGSEFWPTYDEMRKLAGMTLAQLIAVVQLQARSGLTLREFLEGVAVVPRPGIGSLAEPTVLSASFNGIFVGIEPDGYAHS